MRTERYETRDRAYGAWHRAPSIGRYLCHDQAESLTMVDLDAVLFTEYDHRGKLPLALVEVARDIGQEKPAGVMQQLAQLANVPAYVALYTPAPEANPANPNWSDIESFRVRRMWPQPEPGWRILTPTQWARALVQIRGWQMRRFEACAAANDDRY
ncbi:hypothetical protein R69658_07672 [Paraburkholderia aspalathi]|uniref:RES domain-containing protein n=1 Tax=Paraburkholderia aspalathi TaxID=1324617 RepID=A0ABM8T6G9_9BURK|nr:hypothetical protein [Paraburkholderia aspalathi]MBK3823968.1 hypothetical protein [Paraburkholderia aspalathi]MBK3835809.1 hypothetical protein [Paraburkholderia aspalathi]MBK3865588.1 hypothetical protein [Paraburkholderia aspalathi]CAE6862152.1 hypothetical protein R69658_07672 [Paraburkholderia aspalathi]